MVKHVPIGTTFLLLVIAAIIDSELLAQLALAFGTGAAVTFGCMAYLLRRH